MGLRGGLWGVGKLLHTSLWLMLRDPSSRLDQELRTGLRAARKASLLLNLWSGWIYGSWCLKVKRKMLAATLTEPYARFSGSSSAGCRLPRPCLLYTDLLSSLLYACKIVILGVTPGSFRSLSISTPLWLESASEFLPYCWSLLKMSIPNEALQKVSSPQSDLSGPPSDNPSSLPLRLNRRLLQPSARLTSSRRQWQRSSVTFGCWSLRPAK